MITALQLLSLVNEIAGKFHRHKWQNTKKLKFLPVIVEQQCKTCGEYRYRQAFFGSEIWRKGRYEGSPQ